MIFPSPLKVINSLTDGFKNGSFLLSIQASMIRLTIGYSISLVIGIFLGALTGRIKWFDETVGSLILGLQTLPSICWLPFALLWFYPQKEIAIIFVIIMGAVLSISIATRSAIRSIPPIYLKTARTMGVKGVDSYTKVMLPAALPTIVNGMKLGWSFAWRSLMAAELIIYGAAGFGNLLHTGNSYNDMGLVIAVMLMIVIIGLLVDKLFFNFIERKIEEKWGLQRT